MLNKLLKMHKFLDIYLMKILTLCSPAFVTVHGLFVLWFELISLMAVSLDVVKSAQQSAS